ncbi:MAG: acylphosphatase [Bacteroidetes bacterium]|nr:acylphosphatase [Bacteroidota bacterium]
MKRLSIHVTGKVQGVFFRASTATKAKQIGLTGFVRNEKDGSVYLEAQGNEKQLEEFLVWCRRGPERAVVKEIVVDEISFTAQDDFFILK